MARDHPESLLSKMKHKRRIKGGIVAFIGFLLSPLSWWNDLFVNVPLALAFAWAASWFFPSAFTVCFVAGYWLTNVLGFVLMHKGGEALMSDQPSRYTRKSLVRDLAISLLYTALILLLVRLKLVQSLPEYMPHR